ncbi:uncharacterized protein LOC122312670 [Carya illinoinensis]|uniref:uncharacterized protein LOC122312670 n=1 Tax=Carya illinoinensis TaxID=32201 RepID=UPI001C718E99|nr:uncharacterized protein LOC122312670 [Carya illinoinensis]
MGEGSDKDKGGVIGNDVEFVLATQDSELSSRRGSEEKRGEQLLQIRVSGCAFSMCEFVLQRAVQVVRMRFIKVNRIQEVFDEMHRRDTSLEGLAGIFKSYFEKLFFSSEPGFGEINNCLRSVAPSVTSSMNEQLSKVFTREEVEAAVRNMAPYKSPGPDGFEACFYQEHWHLIGEGRLITDNIMVAFEVLHTMKVRKKGKVGNMAIKLDMSKAYDRIELHFLQVVMEKLGFCSKWIELVMKCVSSVSYSVLVNGKPGGPLPRFAGVGYAPATVQKNATN